MCGRFGLFHTWEDMHAAYGLLLSQSFVIPPRYNIAPSQDIVAIIRGAGEAGHQPPAHAVSLLRWGLIPSWAKDPAMGARMKLMGAIARLKKRAEDEEALAVLRGAARRSWHPQSALRGRRRSVR